MTGGAPEAGRALAGRGSGPAGGRLAAVADDVLPPAGSQTRRAAGPRAVVLVAAPGAAATADVAQALRAGAAVRCHDLGRLVEAKIAGWEAERARARAPWRIGPPLLVWCVAGWESVSLDSALALGRIAALVGPQRVALFWYPGRGRPLPGRLPPAPRRARAVALARAAAPSAAVNLHCLGWLGEADRELQDLVRRFG